jgi:hypothetical protein
MHLLGDVKYLLAQRSEFDIAIDGRDPLIVDLRLDFCRDAPQVIRFPDLRFDGSAIGAGYVNLLHRTVVALHGFRPRTLIPCKNSFNFVRHVGT